MLLPADVVIYQIHSLFSGYLFGQSGLVKEPLGADNSPPQPGGTQTNHRGLNTLFQIVQTTCAKISSKPDSNYTYHFQMQHSWFLTTLCSSIHTANTGGCNLAILTSYVKGDSSVSKSIYRAALQGYSYEFWKAFNLTMSPMQLLGVKTSNYIFSQSYISFGFYRTTVALSS